MGRTPRHAARDKPASGRELVVVWAGRHQRRPWQELCASYSDRIGRFAPIREQTVKVKKVAPERRLAAEGEAILAALPDPCRIVVLTREGTAMSSRRFSRWLTRERSRWPHPLAFVVGSDLGVAPSVLEAAWERISLGELTLPHELARLVLYEQIYRAFAIESGIKYHRAPF